MAETSARTTKVFAWGGNVFDQIHFDHPRTSAPYTVPDAAAILAVCAYQTVIRSHSGQIRVLGEAARLLEQAIQTILDDDNDADSSGLVFVGQDMFEAVLDVRKNRCCFLRYAEGEGEERDSSEMVEGSSWETAACDGRGRCMAVDLDGKVYLFDSVAMFRAATGQGEEARNSRDAKRFVAQVFSPDGSSSSSAPTLLPRFDTVSAGNAHFVLLARSSNEVCPVWIYGDARFGAVPLRPFDHTTTVGVLPPSHSPSTPAATDVPHLMPVPHFSPDQGFPSRIANALAGSRHTLILTTDGDLYGWGWNEDSALLPFHTTADTPSWENNIVFEPTLIPLPTSASSDDDTVALTKIAASNARSLGITTEGRLVVAGSNEFGGLALDEVQLGALAKKPRFERAFSQIKKAYECVNGWQLHPELGAAQGATVVQVHATALATFITVEMEQ
ncbi:uncharacterized protein SRS1_12098 [Sporisorium reilianum f. sp. reilianum]|uniref:Uncharacterized protein n=1 Tax=Sporisorium reilianum f. sp. reilianum TaxID=72559 RepID=A0A2N8U7X5_9BASI|nr:uncharacterized protein SRS1_12098 [Sporisorium reilianum f. sp. reilianum]